MYVLRVVGDGEKRLGEFVFWRGGGSGDSGQVTGLTKVDGRETGAKERTGGGRGVGTGGCWGK